MPFIDRVDAGRQLAARLSDFTGPDLVVLGLPRGGVPVAFEVAQALRAPLDVLVVRKLGVPFQPELAMGAIGEGGSRCSTRACWPMRAGPPRSWLRSKSASARSWTTGSPLSRLVVRLRIATLIERDLQCSPDDFLGALSHHPSLPVLERLSLRGPDLGPCSGWLVALFHLIEQPMLGRCGSGTGCPASTLRTASTRR